MILASSAAYLVGLVLGTAVLCKTANVFICPNTFRFEESNVNQKAQNWMLPVLCVAYLETIMSWTRETLDYIFGKKKKKENPVEFVFVY